MKKEHLLKVISQYILIIIEHASLELIISSLQTYRNDGPL